MSKRKKVDWPLVDGELDSRKMRIESCAEDDLNSYSILRSFPSGLKKDVIRKGMQSVELDRAMGAMVGMAIGDSLGAPLEFLPATGSRSESYFDFDTLTFHEEFNKFRLQRGQWT